MEKLNEQLKELYESYIPEFKKIIEEFPERNLMGPLLMSETEEYVNSKVKILIIGQETNGWGYHTEKIEQGMADYSNFNLGEKYFSSPFWNVTRKIEKILGNNHFSCSWTNLSKFDDDTNRPIGKVAEKIAKIDALLLDEIKILKPDVVIFFTSHHFDNRIKNIFDKIEFTSSVGFTEKQCSQLSHKALPKLTFRTYHPKYLRISGLESKFIDLIATF